MFVAACPTVSQESLMYLTVFYLPFELQLLALSLVCEEEAGEFGLIHFYSAVEAA